jgi:hypothetical protein
LKHTKGDLKTLFMDKTVATFIGVVSVVIGLHASRAMHQTNITGKVQAFSTRDSIWVFAVNGKDSLKTMVNKGKFRFTVKPGSWKVTVSPHEGKTVEAVEGNTMDMGTIILN